MLGSFFYKDLSNILAKLGCMDDVYLVVCKRKFPNIKRGNIESAKVDLKRKYCFSMLGKDSMPNMVTERQQHMIIIFYHILSFKCKELFLSMDYKRQLELKNYPYYFLPFFCRIFLLKNEVIKDYLNETFQPLFFLFFKVYFQLNKGRNFSIQDNIF